MRTSALCILLIICMIITIPLNAQNKDRAIFRTNEAGFMQNSIMKDVRDAREKKTTSRSDKSFVVDLSTSQLPNKIDLYKNIQWHNPPISQGNTNTCWCFSTTSFLESEVYRISKMKVKLSEMYTVYWEYVEKTLRYVRERGNSAFAEGSEANAVTRMWKKYGIIPESDFTGLPDGRKFPSHSDMYGEMNSYLTWMKTNSAWDEDAAVAQ